MNLKQIIKEEVRRQLKEGKNFAEIMKGVNQGSQKGPWTIVVSRNRKVVYQQLVKVRDQIPAQVEHVKQTSALPGDLYTIEDETGNVVYSEKIQKGTQ